MHAIRNLEQKMLGLGCSTFGGSNSKKTALQTLHSAYQNGIRYFDIARSYGYGQAESIVGEFVKDKRDKVVIASKFGIAPPKPFPFMDQVKDAVRFVKKLAPGISGKVINAYSVNNVERPRVTPHLAIESLEKSLAEIGTDYLDHYLIHDCPFDQATGDDLCYALEKAKEKGMILKWGATCENDQELRHYFQDDSPFRMVQFPYQAESKFLKNEENKEIYKVLFSVMSQSAGHANPPLSFFRKLPVNQLEYGLVCNLQEAWLYLASRELDNGVVLCSMTNEAHIKRNVAIFNGESLPEGALAQMKKMMLDVQRTGSKSEQPKDLKPSPLQ